ncbi:MAG: hypothetical protein WDA12_04335 [Bacilli bacterium]
MRRMSKLFSISIITVFLFLATFMIDNKKVEALYYPDSYYDAVSWIYQYQAPYTWSYNCLGWATGSMTFEWPSNWGNGGTKQQVDSYMIFKGYKVSNLSPSLKSTRIISYGPSVNNITHFSKVTPTAVTAKWGSLERFTHFISIDPYYANSDYGLSRGNYF